MEVMLPGKSWGIKKEKRKKGVNGLDSVGGVLIFPQKILILLIGLIFFWDYPQITQINGDYASS
jgi:hypothetical protein